MDILLLHVTLKVKPHSFFPSGKDVKEQRHLLMCWLVFSPSVLKVLAQNLHINILYLSHATETVEYSKRMGFWGTSKSYWEGTVSFRAGVDCRPRFQENSQMLSMPAVSAPPPQKAQGCCSQPKAHRHLSRAAHNHTELWTFHTTGKTKQAAQKKIFCNSQAS